ncbi:peptide chain release factor-like protein [bacterium]|nr:peptide chain release factor-like protein [bacterium]
MFVSGEFSLATQLSFYQRSTKCLSSSMGLQYVNRRETAVRLNHRPSGTVVPIQKERSQLRNKEIALETLRERLKHRNKRKPPRIATKKSRGSEEKRLQSKKHQSRKKQLRKKPKIED